MTLSANQFSFRTLDNGTIQAVYRSTKGRICYSSTVVDEDIISKVKDVQNPSQADMDELRRAIRTYRYIAPLYFESQDI